MSSGPWASAALPPVPVDFFYEAGCPVCQRVEHELLPLLEARYGDLVDVRRHDIGDPAAYLLLVAYQKRMDLDPNAAVTLIVNATEGLTGWDAIATGTMDALDRAMAERLAAPTKEAAALPAPPPPADMEDLHARVRTFTAMGVATGGLVDGINPCAISTLVFFISMLSVMRIRGASLLAAGGIFCAVSFLTYIGIGFGLFRLLRLSSGFHRLQSGITWGMIGVLLILAGLSLRDALRYRASGKPGDLALKLPRRLSDVIHRVIRHGVRTRYIFWGSAVAAFLVTVLESVCTGQVYLPTLLLILRSGESNAHVLAYLLLYNGFFILPLILALILAYRGVTTERFLAWSKRNVFRSKLALTAFFVALAALLAML